MVKRSAIVGTGLVLTGLLVGCAGKPAPSSDSPAPNGAAETTASGPHIATPKDAAAVDVCSLLPAEAATASGLKPEGDLTENMIDPDAPDGCTWRDGDGTSVVLTPLSDRSLQEYHDHKSMYVDFQELEIAGHPAVRANEGDRMKDGFCNIFLGTKDGQVLASQTAMISDGQTDPCDLAQKALEASVPTLPAAK
ncbi:DUF3558 domain-containing protein [Saccharopolyspora hordei]|uniref:DUF3558 domain-containing protein n=1 Tax=Saccharopolyspora hordei TaxID=1838 RepID=A0A853AR02_9PSEU|nr:DUF3558 domain-containing protein [Saccharopolyspora hordei]NYI83307.1 hypothetical protein [Saccharopolyspora hordei]